MKLNLSPSLLLSVYVGYLYMLGLGTQKLELPDFAQFFFNFEENFLIFLLGLDNGQSSERNKRNSPNYYFCCLGKNIFLNNSIVFPEFFQSVITASYPLFITDGKKVQTISVLTFLCWKLSLLWIQNFPWWFSKRRGEISPRDGYYSMLCLFSVVFSCLLNTYTSIIVFVQDD